jgi:mRNA-degrading endonuclease toxin of MazEF toxin-antitoxin module
MTPQPIRRGGVYNIADESVVLLPKALRKIIHRERRYFVVLSGDQTNSDKNWFVVAGCPISSSTTQRTRFDVKLAQGEGNVPKKSWVRVPAIQAVEKTDLQDFSGMLDPARLNQIDAFLFSYLGQLPPPPSAPPMSPSV